MIEKILLEKYEKKIIEPFNRIVLVSKEDVKYFSISNKFNLGLCGIKGQYLMFDDGTVLNIRKHNGYEIALEV